MSLWNIDSVGGITLEGFQIEGRDFLLGPGVGGNKLLADRPRLGKSIQTIAALEIRLQMGGHMLIICPPGVRSNWRALILALRKGPWKASVRGYTDIVAGDIPSPEWGAKFDVIVIDEAHALAGRDSQRTQACYGEKFDGHGGVVSRGWETWLLTGTPQPQYPNQIWTHFRALAPSVIINDVTRLPYGYSDFTDRYCYVNRGVAGTQIRGTKNSLELRKRIRPFWLGRDYDVLGPGRQPPIAEMMHVEAVPEQLVEVVELESTPEGRALMTAVENDDLDSLKRVEAQAARLRAAYGLAKIGPVAETIEAECAQDPDLKVVVFAWHRNVIEAVKRRLKKLNPVVIYGGMSDGDKDVSKAKLWKDPKCRVLIGQHLSAGEGIDLSCADELILLEESWVPKDNTQAVMRIFNIAKARRSRVRIPILSGTQDRRVHDAVVKKARSAKEVWGY